MNQKGVGGGDYNFSTWLRPVFFNLITDRSTSLRRKKDEMEMAVWSFSALPIIFNILQPSNCNCKVKKY